MLIHFFSYALAIYFFKYFSAVKILQEKPLIFFTLSILSGKQYPAICSILSSSFYKIIKSVSITRLQDIQFTREISSGIQSTRKIISQNTIDNTIIGR